MTLNLEIIVLYQHYIHMNYEIGYPISMQVNSCSQEA